MKTKTKNYEVSKIRYDYGSENCGFSKPELPSCLIIEDVPSDVSNSPIELEDYLANEISNKTGFCVETFLFKLIK